MPRYIELGTGRELEPDDPDRGVWYSNNPSCAYWTDDWDLLGRTSPDDDKPKDARTAGWKDGIPCCPYCSAPGMQIRYHEWMTKARGFEEKANPRYVEFVLLCRERCGQLSQRTFLQRYNDYVKDDHDHSTDVSDTTG